MRKFSLQSILFGFLFFISQTLMAQDIESLKIVWPEEYKWKVITNQEDGGTHFLELVPGNDSGENWTMLGSMMSIKGVKGLPIDTAMNLFYSQAKQNAPEAKLTFLEKDINTKSPWVLFKIESPNFKNDGKPESQLYYIILGNGSLYVNFIALKEKELEKDFVEKWGTIFKASELVILTK